MVELALESGSGDKTRYHLTNKDELCMETLCPLSTSPGSLPPCSPLFYSQDMITAPNLHINKFSIQGCLLFLNPGPGNPSHLDFYPITWVP